MTYEAIEPRIKCRIHDAIVGVLLVEDEQRKPVWDRHRLKRTTHREWSRAEWNRLIAGPTRHPHSIDKLALVARGLGYDVADDGTCTPARPKQLPRRHVVPLAA